MKTVRVISIVVIVALAGEAVGQPPALSLTFEPSNQTVDWGNSVDVGIRISGLGDFAAPSLGTFDLDIAYNPAILSFSTVAYGDPGLGDQLDLMGFGAITATTPSAGLVNLFELSLDFSDDLDAFQAADFILATLTFDTLGVGMSPLSFSSAILGDSLGDPLFATLGTGSVTVETTVVPVPGAFLLGWLGIGSAGWFFRRRGQSDR